MAKRQVSLREANQHLSRYVAEVEKGAEVLITRRGKPVARLTGIPEHRRISREQRAALTRLKSGARALQIGRMRREELYDRSER
ncbi:MAG: type II toxin-antitoxin system prevent-host-death family antitoxin [Burkholderiales bacterium]|nr:type II toxin-antitoxin system prevent-host-death family antitoxin [Burkholderiales bacterium]